MVNVIYATRSFVFMLIACASNVKGFLGRMSKNHAPRPLGDSRKISKLMQQNQTPKQHHASSFEVERKFNLLHCDMSQVKSRIKGLGFVPQGKGIQMVDWYFDTSEYDLVLQDCWLRLRQKRQLEDNCDWCEVPGQWELKRGRKRERDQATVYEEIEGTPGFEAALELVPKQSVKRHADLPLDLVGLLLPKLPEHDACLIPFARILTERISYQSTSPDGMKLTIDLDTTDFGHAVGEVEAIAATENELTKAQEQVQTILERLVLDKDNEPAAEDPSQAAQGKLEVYIEKNRPELYLKLIDSGII